MSGQGDEQDEPIVAHIRAILARTAETLAAGGARDEALARFVPARRAFLVPRPAVMEPLGRVWRLGAFLLGHDAALRATGAIARAVEPGHPGHVSVSAESRREQRAAAFRGPFERGETVNFDAPELSLDPERLRTDSTGPLFLRGDLPVVRWSAALSDDAAMPLDAYLSERADLLLHPPEGA